MAVTSTKNKLGQQRSRSSSRKQSRGESLKAESPPTKLDAASATTAKIIRNTHARSFYLFFYFCCLFSRVYFHHNPNRGGGDAWEVTSSSSEQIFISTPVICKKTKKLVVESSYFKRNKIPGSQQQHLPIV